MHRAVLLLLMTLAQNLHGARAQSRLAAFSAAGFLGAIVIAISSWSAGATFEPMATPISHAARFGLEVAKTERDGPGYWIFWVGLGVLAAAWMLLGHELFQDGRSDSGKLMLRTSLLWAAPLLFAAPIESRDLWACRVLTDPPGWG